MASSGNAQIIREIINPDEQYIWDVTGSVADVKYNPIYLILSIVTLGIFLLILYFKRIFRAYVLTNQRLIVITGIFSKQVDEIELFRIVDSSFEVQNADGTTKTVRPWEEASVVGIPNEIVGRLVYGTLAEETNPVDGVSYQKSGSFLLISKYSHNDPLEEYTSGQALCLPVLDGANGIYLLNANYTAPVTGE